MASTFFTPIETKLTALLADIVNDTNGVKILETQQLNSISDIEDLLGKFTNRTPCAFLSVPNIQITPAQSSRGPIRVSDVRLSHSVLFVVTERRTPAERREILRELVEEFLRLSANQAVTETGIAATYIDFIAVNNVAFSESPEYSAALATFDVVVRNWHVNTPA